MLGVFLHAPYQGARHDFKVKIYIGSVCSKNCMHLGCRKLSRKLEIFSKSNFTKHRDNQEQKSLRLPSFTPSSPISRLKHRCGLVQIPSSTFSTLILGKGSPENSFFTFSLTIFAPDCSFYVSFWFLILKVSSNSL